ncbi:MAG: recombinase family protein [Candidatus Gracilibacteria bacterium]|nr:recombinase family protein [Candidatus Gracilibacteria bacterium]
MSKKYFIYTRVSDDGYEKSIDNQKEILLKLAEKDGIYKENIEFKSEIVSSKKGSKRDEFDDMLEALEKDEKKYKGNPGFRKYGGVYFFKIDRLSRNDKDFQKIFNLLDAGYIFKSATETIENTPTGRLLFRMLSSFAIFEVEKLSSRESVAQIHNILLKRFKNLGGKIAIFGYKIMEKTGNIKVVEKEKDIILDIYEMYRQSKEGIFEKKLTYKDIFNKINEKYDGYILKYLKEKSSISNQNKFIENVLKNDNMMRYNGYIERTLKINDELIKNYIETIIDKKEDFYEITGGNKIGGKIKFSFYFEEYVIVNDILNNRVKEFLNQNKNKNPGIKNIKYCGLFEYITYFKKDGELYKLSKPYHNKVKNTYHYRRTVNGKNYEISELTGLENKIKRCGIVDKILGLSDKQIIKIKKQLEEIEKNEQKGELAKLTGTKNIYNKSIERYTFLLQESETKKEILDYSKMKKVFEDYVSNIDKEIEIIKEDKNYNIEIFINLLTIKNFYSQDIYTKRDFYVTFFEKLIYDENKNVTIVLPDYLAELGLPKEINT